MRYLPYISSRLINPPLSFLNKLSSIKQILGKMNTKDLLKEAIADAKAVRETALAQAKLALEEAFSSRFQSMFASRLQEELDEELEENTTQEEYADRGNRMKEAEEAMDENYGMEEEGMEDIDLDAILAELDEEMSKEINEAKEEEEEVGEEEEIEGKEDEEDVEDEAKEDAEEEKEVSELSMDELEDLIRDIVSQEVGGEGGEEVGAEEDQMDLDMDMTADTELPDTTDDEVNLEEILAELLGEEEELDERKKYGGNKGDVPAAKRGDKKDTAEEEGVEDYKKKKMEEDLQLALEAVETLRSELQEVNLLNAKLLYVNKIFKAKNLTESQKLKVVKAFDKAESAKEAKLVFESLSETFNAKAEKSQIKESLGFASKATGVVAKTTIVEGSEWIARMQKLANIK
jgi:hypothetical protein